MEAVEVDAGEIFLLPTRAVDGDVDDDASLSEFSEKEFGVYLSENEAKEVERFCEEADVDVDGREFPHDAIFDSFHEAAEFAPCALAGEPVEVECVALWDHFGGNTFADANVLAGETVLVVAEEYQVRCLDSYKFARLPVQWSLARRVSGRPIDVHMGLIPSHFLVSKQFYHDHPLLFQNPSWFRGSCDLQEVCKEFFKEQSLLRPGMFVIFSPPWLNPDPSEHRPYFLMMVTRNMEEADDSELTDFEQMGEDIQERLRRAPEGLQMSPEEARDEEVEEQAKAVAKKLLPMFLTIQRSSFGHFELFGDRYWTLFDLVFHLANHQSALPHRLIYQRVSISSVRRESVPKPVLHVERDFAAQPMASEQWAANYYEQVTSRFLQSEKFKCVTRMALDPTKKEHKRVVYTPEVPATIFKEASCFYDTFKKPKDRKPSEDGSSETQTKSWSGFPKQHTVIYSESPFYLEPRNVTGTSSTLGSGAFGTVVIGNLKTAHSTFEVAIKKISMQIPEKQQRELWQNQSVLMVFELMDDSLDKFVEKCGAKISENEQVDLMQQICRGMDYLHSMSPPIVHADLAARNVLLREHHFEPQKLVAKITDYGLSKPARDETFATYDDPNKIPFKWLPPEVLTQRELSPKTDVWSFGMVCFEFYGIGEPYGVLPAAKVYNFLNDGYRFEKQNNMPSYIYEITLECWRKQPVDRPTFAEIERRLRKFYIENEKEDILMQDVRKSVLNERKNMKIREEMEKQIRGL
ncbi:unnamed protein product [Caenorhabditis auriculariae]|uniref:Protein kinase domain-containing protein n=1 Tax=Caenorhabditis auriculariae TaxID=2777116 RepID=A0A8S1H9Z6_9PELO|nr:unnamed protein product [Caenorhabditis auriculariae]